MKRLLLTLALCSCGAPPDYVSQRGASYFFQGHNWLPSQIEAQEGYLIENVPKVGHYSEAQVSAALARSTVYLMAPAFACGEDISPSGRCNGLQINGLIEVSDMGCPFNSALTHEVAHVMQSSAGVYDPNHTDVELWAVADKSNQFCGALVP